MSGGMMMHFKLDHIVHFTEDPARAVKDMKALGFSAFNGGEDANWGTENGLCHFGLTYIEFLGIKHRNIAKSVTDNTLIRQLVAEPEDGLARLALRVDNINQAAEHFRSLGLSVIGPVPGSRKQLDGKLLQWSMLFIENDGPDPFCLPFIIDWKQTDDERKQQLVRRGLITEHPVGVIHLAEIVLPTRNLKKSIQEWKTFFGANIGESFTDTNLNAHCTRIILDDQSILCCEPLGPGPLEDHLVKRGARPFYIAFSGTGQTKLVTLNGANYVFR
jgi:hypothetical protein